LPDRRSKSDYYVQITFVIYLCRFERGPVTEPDSYWDKMPKKRAETYRHLPLDHAGCASDINEAAIVRAHDRAMPLR